ncbi:hypothetical protein CAG64_13960 [Vibrio sp. V38_P2S17PM301]|uniref:hypothetical protein n=2 Tax=Vibrio TaxID=662 RepID=UPI0013614D08|nr:MULTISPECIES: hypothetical protein [unclassified Vibrio]NAX26548.1 hypothetical protein [Vibrio sp. V38_P2S17PM301]NAX30068.1 hypothetical protein [Vibrio sp. V37_P2S8PM304]
MAFEIKRLNVSPEDLEQLGTKEKFWFNFKGGNVRWLFKYSRENTGEHWSEKVAEELCKELGIPHVKYEMAQMNERYGIVSPNVIPEQCRMVMGNEVLHKDSPSTYPEPVKDTQQFVRIKEHTVQRVLGCFDLSHISPPKGWDSIEDLNAGDVFCGYLMLDALISNQDRHHENWAIVINTETQEKYLCETYDHAASLGRELLDKEREDRLTSKDKNRQVGKFVQKARSELFKLKTDRKPLLTNEAFFLSVEKRENAKVFWLERLRALTDEKINAIFNKIPTEVISDVAREFSLKMVLENKKRLLEDDRV